MAYLSLVLAPHPIFKQKSEPVKEVTDEIQSLMKDMLNTLYHEHGIGMAATMVGILKRIVVIDLQENHIPKPLFLVNPEIVEASSEVQEIEEASLCFPGISAEVKRPRAIKVKYIDFEGSQQELEAEGLLATVIQHEMDYMDGIVFWDYLTPMKREMLKKKMVKFLKKNPPHVHGAHCNH